MILKILDDKHRMNELDALSIVTDILPSQFADTHRRAPQFPAELGLLFAILESACWDIQGKKKKERTEAVRWIRSGSTALFSFAQVCDAFGWNVEWFRAGLLEWASVVAEDRVRRTQRRRSSRVVPDSHPLDWHRRGRKRKCA
jgi:hypothetical protein